MAIKKPIDNKYQIPIEYSVITSTQASLGSMQVTVSTWQNRARYQSGAAPLSTLTFTYPLPIPPNSDLEAYAIAHEPVFAGGTIVP
jgi:hypothetical protein